MGDTPINPASTEQLSWLIYSRKVTDKKKWADMFNIGIDKFTKKKKRRPTLSKSRFRDMVVANTEVIKKTSATKCLHCNGTGLIRKFKVNGTI